MAEEREQRDEDKWISTQVRHAWVKQMQRPSTQRQSRCGDLVRLTSASDSTALPSMPSVWSCVEAVRLLASVLFFDHRVVQSWNWRQSVKKAKTIHRYLKEHYISVFPDDSWLVVHNSWCKTLCFAVFGTKKCWEVMLLIYDIMGGCNKCSWDYILYKCTFWCSLFAGALKIYRWRVALWILHVVKLNSSVICN